MTGVQTCALPICVFFKDLSQFFYVALLFMFALGLPIASYMFPAFMMPMFKYIPSYPVVFGVREIIFDTGKEGFMMPIVLTLIIENIVLFVLGYMAIDRRLMKEGR